MSFPTLKVAAKMNQGDDFIATLTLKGPSGPLNLTGYTFFGEMKLDTAAASTVLAEFTFIVLSQATNLGQVQWILPSSVTAALLTSASTPEQPNRLTTPYVFDVKMKDPSGNTSRIMEGIAYVSPQVTQETS